MHSAIDTNRSNRARHCSTSKLALAIASLMRFKARYRHNYSDSLKSNAFDAMAAYPYPHTPQEHPISAAGN